VFFHFLKSRFLGLGPWDPFFSKTSGQPREVKSQNHVEILYNCRLDEYLGVLIFIFENLSF